MKQRPTIGCQVIFRLLPDPNTIATVLSDMEAELTGETPRHQVMIQELLAGKVGLA